MLSVIETLETSAIVAEYLKECRYRNLADKTMEQKEWALGFLMERCPDLPRSGRELLEVVSQPGHGLESRRHVVKCLKAFFRWCGRRYSWPNPVDELERLPRRKRLPRVLTELEVQQLLAAAGNQRDLVLVVLMLDTGLRLKEIANLRWSDVGPDYITVRDGKSGDRMAPLCEEVKRLMLGLGDGTYIWVGPKGPLTWSGMQQAYRRLFRRSGLTGPKLGPHILRHTFATQYISAGGNVFSLKEILGHSSIKTTEIYVTLAQRHTKADHALYSPVRTLGLLEKLQEQAI